LQSRAIMLSEVELRALIDSSPVVHYVARTSADYGVLYVSESVRERLGYAPAQFTDDPNFWASCLHSDDRLRVLADLATTSGGERRVHEYRFRHADGTWRWIHDERVLTGDTAGNPYRVIGSWLDVTARKEAEQADREVAGRLREAQRIAGIGSWEIDTATSKQWWSEETYRILGQDPRTYEPSAESFLAKIHDDDRQRFLDAVQRALEDGKPYAINYRLVLPDGSEKVIHGRGRGIAKGDGAVTHFAGTVQDVTERERIEQALRAAEARNRALLEANPDVIFRIDSQGRFLDLSVSSRTMFPYTRTDLVGRNVSELFGEEFAREQQRHVRKAIETGETQLWECRMPVGDGHVDLEARFVRSGEREAVVTVRDVTDRLALQREIVATQERERGRIGRDLHDGLGQELTGISLGLEALVQKLAAEQSPHLPAVRHLKSMTQKSISVTRRIAMSLSPGFGVDFGIGEALMSLAGEVADHSAVRCRASCSARHHRHDIEVETNVYRIAQESVTNALKHGRPKNIELHFSCDGRAIQLEVLDDGIGIPADGERMEGMGLRSMRYRAHLMNGSIELGPRADGGTRVSFVCPCRI
jgi:PAS domain S-box-containing protein